MSVNYGEIICNAVDEIVTARLAGLQYDITKLCTIIDDDYSYQGKYTVSDGTAKYDAFSTDSTLKSGNQVLVTIPNGDYTMQKTIAGRVATTDTTPFNYTPPLDTIIKITNNVFDNARTVYGENAGLLANGSTKMIGPIYSLTSDNDLDGYTRLGLSANFRSWLTGLDVASGSYGIKVLIYTNMVQEAGAAAANTVYELTFSSADMIGNPYQFEDYFYQEKVFDISNITNIQKLEVYFYQDSNFLDSTGDLIPWQDSDAVLGNTDKLNNLFVNDVKLYMGYELGAFTDETLIVHTPDSMTYRYDKDNNKEINLRWIHKIDETNYEVLTSNNFDVDKYEIHWFRYNPGYELIDQYAGKDWEEVQSGGFNYILTPEVKNQTEMVKVIGLIRSEATDNVSPYYSNILTFQNEELVPDQTTLKASTALSIRCEDNSEGNYLLYDQNGKLINEGLGKGYIRYFKAMYLGAEITEDLGTVNWIKWYFPKSGQTMLVTTNEMYTVDKGEITDQDYHYKGTNYIEITRTLDDGEKIPAVTQAYSIDNYWNAQLSNNTVICRISINGVEYEAIEELHFGKAGSNGTSTTFFIEFADNNNALVAGSKEPVEVRARLYLGEDATASGIPQGMNINWEWYKGSGKYAALSTSPSDTSYCLLICDTETVPKDNYMILKASLKIDTITLEAYLPIPIKVKECDYMEGAREIIYDHQGNPSYYDGAYVAYYDRNDNNYKEDRDWTLRYNDTAEGLSKSYIPELAKLSTSEGYYVISPASFYASGYNDEICVSCKHWSQPLLIMQSKYDLAMLNSWSGKTLELDEDNGTILSTMLGAGRKNSNNTFSGVLLGDIREGTGNNSTDSQTGVYGLHEGIVSYALKEDGTATFGKKGHGQIKIDGNSGTIESGKYDEYGGMSIDLDKGTINIQDSNKKDIINIGDDMSSNNFHNYLKVNNTDGKTLIEISDGNYYLQSPDGFTKFDLSEGSLKVATANSSIELTTSNDKYLFSVISGQRDLIRMGKSEYYLQSAGFTGQTQETTTVDGSVRYKYYNPNKTFYIATGKSISNASSQYKNVYVDNSNIVYDNNGTKISFSNVDITATDDKGDEITDSMDASTVRQKFISSLSPIMKTITNTGLKIDLIEGSIKGYNLYLTGIKGTDTSKRFVLDGSASTTPFSIGDNFSVDWDGTVNCSKVNSLNNDGRGQYAISIGNNFYVTANGTAGGGTWQGSSLGVSGYSPKTITSGGATYYVLGK